MRPPVESSSASQSSGLSKAGERLLGHVESRFTNKRTFKRRAGNIETHNWPRSDEHRLTRPRGRGIWRQLEGVGKKLLTRETNYSKQTKNVARSVIRTTNPSSPCLPRFGFAQHEPKATLRGKASGTHDVQTWTVC